MNMHNIYVYSIFALIWPFYSKSALKDIDPKKQFHQESPRMYTIIIESSLCPILPIKLHSREDVTALKLMDQGTFDASHNILPTAIHFNCMDLNMHKTAEDVNRAAEIKENLALIRDELTKKLSRYSMRKS